MFFVDLAKTIVFSYHWRVERVAVFSLPHPGWGEILKRFRNGEIWVIISLSIFLLKASVKTVNYTAEGREPTW